MSKRIERLAVGGAASVVAAIAAYVALRGLGLLPIVAGLLAVGIAIAGGWSLAKRLPDTLDGLMRRRPWVSAAWLLASLVAVGLTARQAVFMLDPTLTGYSILTGDEWTVQHCCLTAYHEAARAARAGHDNIYSPDLYKPGPVEDRYLDGFTVDQYHYPPPFLLLPRLVQGATGGAFLAVRAVWFGVTALILLLAIGLLAYRFDGRARLRAVATAPVLWCSLPVQLVLQMSNYQVLVVTLSVLAFVAFPRRVAIGGALLALAAVTKIFPGILGVYLLARRRWREAAWTIGIALLLSLLALAVVGPAPFRAFVDFELPRLSSGEAFNRPLSRPAPAARNMAPFGLPLKLDHLAATELGLPAGRVVSLAYTALVIALALWAARRKTQTRDEEAAIWLALLSLGTLVSPFAPGNYVLTSLVWLACIDPRLSRPALLAPIWMVASIPLLLSREAPYVTQLLVFLPAQVAAIGIPAFVLYRAGRATATGTPLAASHAV